MSIRLWAVGSTRRTCPSRHPNAIPQASTRYSRRGFPTRLASAHRDTATTRLLRTAMMRRRRFAVLCTLRSILRRWALLTPLYSGMTAYDSGLGCNSQVSADTELYVDGSTITVDQAVLAVHGVYVAWASSYPASSSDPSSSSSAVASVRAPVAYDPPSSSAVPASTSSTLVRSTSASDTHATSSGGNVQSESSSSAERSTSSSTSHSTLTPPANLQPSTVTVTENSHTPTTSAKPSHDLSTKAKAGIGAGVAVGGLAAIALVVWLILAWRKKRRAESDGESDSYGQPELMYSEKRDPSVTNKTHHISELSTEGARSELSGVSRWVVAQEKDSRVELDS